MFTAKRKLESGNQKKQNSWQAAILKMMSLKINRFLPMTTINMYMKFEIETSKTNLTCAPETMPPTVQKLKKTIWPPGGYFENDVAENQ